MRNAEREKLANKLIEPDQTLTEKLKEREKMVRELLFAPHHIDSSAPFRDRYIDLAELSASFFTMPRFRLLRWLTMPFVIMRGKLILGST